MKTRYLRLLFFGIVIIYLILLYLPDRSFWLWVLKPMIVGTLILLVCQYTFTRDIEQKLLLSALSFSVIGDIFLMLPGGLFLLFLGGLLSFLIAHLFYILIFYREIDRLKANFQFFMITALVGLTYGAAFLYSIKASTGDLLVPVIFYMAIILTMLLLAVNRKGQVSSASYWHVTLGAVLFVASDSILAINKFYHPLRHAAFLTMLTYSVAQYAIVQGIIIAKAKN